MSELFSWRLLAGVVALVPWVAQAAPALAPANAALHDTRWQVQALDGAPLDAPTAEPVQLMLRVSDQHLSGFAGCNRLLGRYLQRGTQIALSVAGSTRMACPAPQMAQERHLIELLDGVNAYRIEGAVLSLMQGDAVRITLRAANTR